MNDPGLHAAVAALIARWFGPAAPQQELAAGEVLLRAGERNTRLYHIRAGSFLLRSERRTEIRLGPGNLIGIQSLFLHRFTSVWTAIADEPSAVAALDLAQDHPAGRPWEVELMPLVIGELNHRQQRVRDMEEAQHATQQRLQELLYISTLGQMAAGVAHELNNALAVLGRGTDWLRAAVTTVAACNTPLRRELLTAGLEHGHRRRAGELEPRAAALRKRGLGFGEARRLAGLALDDAQLEALLADDERETALTFFELGATLADMAQSATQAGHVVRSLKQLAARERLDAQELDLGETIEIALSICRNALGRIAVGVERPDEPVRVEGNQGELVQVWTNLIQNACDALHRSGRDQPRIVIALARAGDDALVTIDDNGPGIDPAVADDIFMPHVTTKTDGLHFGLGLGLSIVQQVVKRYGGEVAAGAAPGGGARFTVRLPRRIAATTAWLLDRLSQQRSPSPEDPA